MANRTPKISILAPTRNRHWAFPQLLRCLRAQSLRPHEVLIWDSSPQPYAPMFKNPQDGVTYRHLAVENEIIGEKRNAMCEAATGDIVVFFDDDDFYHSTYVETMVAVLAAKRADLVKLLSFYCFHAGHRLLGHVDLRQRHGTLWDWRGATPKRVPANEIEFGGEYHLGYSANFVFAREAWRAQPFEPRPWRSDSIWASAVIDQGATAVGVDDTVGRHLHLCHGGNISSVFPARLTAPSQAAVFNREFRAFVEERGGDTRPPAPVDLPPGRRDDPRYGAVLTSPLQHAPS